MKEWRIVISVILTRVRRALDKGILIIKEYGKLIKQEYKMNTQFYDCINYQYDELFPIYPPKFTFDEISHNGSIFEDPLSEIVLSPSTDPPEDSFTVEQADNEPQIDNEKAKNRRSRIKDKVSKAKAKHPEKKKLIKKEPVDDRKQSLVLRNRLSAQKSREKKKEEVANLKQANEQLERSKQETEEKLALANAELEAMKATVEQLSPEGREEFNRIYFGFTQSKPRYRIPFLMAGALLGCICLVCCIAPFMFTEQIILTPPNRLLLEPGKYDLKTRANSTELMLYNNNFFEKPAISSNSRVNTIYTERAYLIKRSNSSSIMYFWV